MCNGIAFLGYLYSPLEAEPVKIEAQYIVVKSSFRTMSGGTQNRLLSDSPLRHAECAPLCAHESLSKQRFERLHGIVTVVALEVPRACSGTVWSEEQRVRMLRNSFRARMRKSGRRLRSCL
jgi:hypothetical protein